LSPSTRVIVGAGVGLHDGFGTPDWQVFGALRFNNGYGLRRGRGEASDPDVEPSEPVVARTKPAAERKVAKEPKERREPERRARGEKDTASPIITVEGV